MHSLALHAPPPFQRQSHSLALHAPFFKNPGANPLLAGGLGPQAHALHAAETKGPTIMSGGRLWFLTT